MHNLLISWSTPSIVLTSTCVSKYRNQCSQLLTIHNSQFDSMSLTSVPTIDVSHLLSTSNQVQKDKSIVELGCAFREWEFFYIKNHGVSDAVINSFRNEMSTFFHLPENVLNNIRRNQKNSRGYFDDVLTKNKIDWKRCFDFGAQDGSLGLLPRWYPGARRGPPA